MASSLRLVGFVLATASLFPASNLSAQCSPTALEIPNNGTDEDCDGLDDLYLVLPPYTYALVGQDLEVYFRNLILSKHPADYSYSVVTTLGGTNFGDRWQFTPTAAQVGTANLTVQVKTPGGTVLASASTTVRISPSTAPANMSAKKLILYGHSYFDQGYLPKYLNDLTNQANNPPISYHGKKQSWATPFPHHEGYGGMMWRWFIQNPGSPFRYGAGINLKQYFDDVCGAGQRPDWMIINMDINDFCGYTSLAGNTLQEIDDSITNDWNTYAKRIIDSIRVAAPNCKLGICMAPPPNARQSAFDNTYGGNPVLSNRWRWQKIISRLFFKNIERYANREGENIFLVPQQLDVDDFAEYNPPDARHLDPPDNLITTHCGYNEIAKSLYAWIKFVENLGSPSGNDWFRDADGDGFGNVNIKLTQTTQPAGYVANSTDCNDSNAAIKPGATEICANGIDENCSGAADEGCPPPGQFCTGSSIAPWEDWIASVKVGAVTKASGKSAYSDFTATSFAVSNGGSFTLTTGYSWLTFDEYWRIYIDLNNDFDFADPGEKVYEGILLKPANGANVTGTLNGTFSLPVGTPTVTARMRVIMKRGAHGLPCEMFSYGEVEDFTANVTGNVPVCSLAATATNVVCSDNGTPSISTDDKFSFTLNVTGSNTGTSGWTTTVAGATQTGSFGTPKTLSGYNISSGNLTFTVSDASISGCSAPAVTVVAPAPCSVPPPCSISASVSNIQCSDNGTPSNLTDDKFSFSLNVAGSNTGTSGWTATVAGATQTGVFGSPKTLSGYNISGGNLSFTVRDASISTCSAAVSVTAPAPCSVPPPCSISANVSNIQCSDNGTPSNLTDDKFSFSLNVTGSNTGTSGWTATVAGATQTGSFGSPKTLSGYNISGGNLSFTVRDASIATCTAAASVVAPAPCSVPPPCSISANISGIQCSDNATPSDPADDKFSFTLNVNGSNTGTSGWSANIAGQTQTGSFGIPRTFSGYNIAAGNLNFTVTDASIGTCSTTATVVAPAPCSVPPNTCSISANVSNIRCADSGTSNDPTDDTYTFDLNVIGSNTGTSGWTTTVNGQSQHGDYGAQITFGIFPIVNGNLSLTVSDVDNATCQTTATAVAPAPCSAAPPCSLTATVSNIQCSDNATPNTGTDDKFSFTLNVNGSNTGTSGWRATVNGVLQTGSYGVPKTLSGYNISGGNLSFSVVDASIGTCSSPANVAAPAPCSVPLCSLTASVSNIQCSDNGTGNAQDDKFSFDLLVTGSNTGTSGWLATIGGTTQTGSFGVAKSLSGYNISGGNLTFTVLDGNIATCTASATAVAPAPCSTTPQCLISASVTNILCSDNSSPLNPADDKFSFNLTVTGSNTGNFGWNATVAGTSQVGLYGVPKSLSGYNIAAGALTFTVRDAATSSCSANVTVAPPATCSNVVASDLQITTLANFPASMAQGAAGSFNYTLRNTGNTTASGTYTIGAYLSVDNVLTSLDPLVGTLPQSNTAVGTFPGLIGNFTVPTSVVAGTYYLILKADIFNNVAEASESNNILVSATKITVTAAAPKPDISLELALSTPPPAPWTHFSMTVKVKNTGNTDATNVKVSIPAPTKIGYEGGAEFLPTTANFTPYSTQLWTVGTVAVGATITLTINYFQNGATSAIFYGQVTSQTPADLDSAPNNGTCCVPVEDDEARVSFGTTVLGNGSGRAADPVTATDVDNFTLFPNPAGEAVSLDLERWLGREGVRIGFYTPTGVLVREEFFQKLAEPLVELDLSRMMNGQYFLRLEAAGVRLLVRKLVVCRMY